MADSPILPGVQAWKDGSGKPLPPEFFRFLRDLVRYLQEITGNTVSIADILDRLAALEADEDNPATITGPESVQVQGSLESGSVQLRLDGDQFNPLPSYMYSADGNRVKGWNPIFPDWVPNPYAIYMVDEDGNYLVDELGRFMVSDTGYPINPDFLPDHNQVNGLQGGNSTERYHLTAAQHAEVAAILAAAPVNVTGSRGGNAALASLLTALATIGLITDSTTA